jgi:hypothetical protein
MRLIVLPFLGVAAGLGAALLFLLFGLGATPRDEAVARAQELVPTGADAAPVGEFAPPFWYGAIYTINQSFLGGGEDRASLAESMLSHLDSMRWEVSEVEELPGATVVHASTADLTARVALYGPPSTPRVEGLIQVRYRARDGSLMLLAGGFLGGAAGLAFAVITFLRSGGRK